MRYDVGTVVAKIDNKLMIKFSRNNLVHGWVPQNKEIFEVTEISAEHMFSFRNSEIYFYDKFIYYLPFITLGISVGVRAVYIFFTWNTFVEVW